MAARERQIRLLLHQWVDACLFGLSFWLAYALRTHPRVCEWLDLPPVPIPFDAYLWVYLLLIPAGPLTLEALGFYRRPVLGPRWQMTWCLLRGVVLVCMGLTLLLFFTQLVTPRWMVVWFGGLAFGLVYTKQELLRWMYRRRLTQPQFRRRVVLVGVPSELARLRRQVEAHPDEGMDVVAELDVTREDPARLVQLLHEHSVNGVIISAEHTHFEQVQQVIRACETEGVEAWLMAEFFRTEISRTTLDDFYGRPVLVFRATPDKPVQLLLKRVVDVVGALVLLTVLAIPLLGVALLIRLTSPGPVLFRQQRAGLNGRPFTMYKFRSMVTNAEQLKHELEQLNEMSGPVFKLTNDPRVTPIGRFLRRYSIDELPQLINVLRGEMSLVGPRPLPLDEVARFDDVAHRRRLSVKPGLTCLWQISGRSELRDFKEWVRLDLEYIDHWSLWLDFKILLRTIPVVLTAKGAK
ncbi:sugar transferase [Limisphaera sp. VF-2]|jgi:exopolysaccharide biosynthesis polyprenyl glycosylphosphotransferase|uniref:sugar transferase n=1 Tax=Limisphaera sp. VF-2 TaxID=3400418 RepID=UPI001759A673|nr:sugar transferase [Limisphaera sp.]